MIPVITEYEYDKTNSMDIHSLCYLLTLVHVLERRWLTNIHFSGGGVHRAGRASSPIKASKGIYVLTSAFSMRLAARCNLIVYLHIITKFNLAIA